MYKDSLWNDFLKNKLVLKPNKPIIPFKKSYNAAQV